MKAFSFFFQAEDGIRVLIVTGVQTCALPISGKASVALSAEQGAAWISLAAMWASDCRIHRLCNALRIVSISDCEITSTGWYRSEERRVGKECRSRWWWQHQ